MDVRGWKCEGQGNLALHVDVFELVLRSEPWPSSWCMRSDTLSNGARSRSVHLSLTFFP